MIDDKAFEEQKREKCVDPRRRWKILQESIAWVDAQQPIPRNSKESCMMRQRQFDKRQAGESE